MRAVLKATDTAYNLHLTCGERPAFRGGDGPLRIVAAAGRPTCVALQEETLNLASLHRRARQAYDPAADGAVCPRWGDGVSTRDGVLCPGGNCTQAIVSAIGSAKHPILTQAYSFTSAPIAKALLDAHRRGVQVGFPVVNGKFLALRN
jgi:phosphatidylserine/phosphatidylglycerophosphate/cardiolipin synthase-like enzyme